MKPYLSLVIPAYNEEKRLGKSLEKAYKYFTDNNIDYEIIVVDDGSSDDTIGVARAARGNIRAIGQPANMGKGAAVRRGMFESLGEVRMFADADFSTPIHETGKLLGAISSGADVFIGSRGLDYGMIREHQPFYREFMGKTFNFIVQSLLLRGISDTQCGFKGFTERASSIIFPQTKIDGFGFDVEILYLARRAGLEIAEIPVEWYNDERSTVNPVKDSIRMFLDVLRVRRLHSGQPK
ncbi:MAG: dolichyl-phosphate beta-glucosyltransferase [Candidatus Kapaibacterium sp.]